VSYLRSGGCCPDPNDPVVNPLYRRPAIAVSTEMRNNLAGGPQGVVRSADGETLEGMMIDLAPQGSSLRTTVFSDERGRYEFPKLPAGSYTLQIVRPLEFRPYQRNSVPIDGATHLDDIALEPITKSLDLPATPEIATQLTGVEWLMNLAGTGAEKQTFLRSCTNCHSIYQIVRNRHSERSWRLIVNRMFRMTHMLDTRPEYSRGATAEDREAMARFLGRVRGPESIDDPFVVLPRPRGAATRAIVTEYELPHQWAFPVEVAGDSKGNIWYISERGPYMGRLDPRTGIIHEYRLPSRPGIHPGANSLAIDKKDGVWIWEGGTENVVLTIFKFDPGTETFHEVGLPPREGDDPVRMALGPDGSIWSSWNNWLNKIDPETGKYLKRYPLKVGATFDNLVSADGRFWAGGNFFLDTSQDKVSEVNTRDLGGASKGGFDREDNAWFGVRRGLLAKVDTRSGRAIEYFPPTPYVTFSEAMPDKNGEVWAGYDDGGRMARFNPRTGRWIEYETPNPYVHDQRTYIDNSTDPVSIWYANLNEIVHIQALE
jgi:streptogramin lyase